MVEVGVNDIDGYRQVIHAGEVVDANKGVRLSALTDPDGNKVWLIGGFRVQY